MKKQSILVLTFLCVFIFCINCIAEQVEEKVTVSGEAMIQNADTAGAKRQALESAYRTAVEQGIGVLIDSETLTKNYEVIYDKVLAKAQGYIKSYKILTEGKFGPNYRVTIEAVVGMKEVAHDLTEFGLLKEQIRYPRLMVAFGTEDGAITEASRSARIAFEKLFAEQHYELIDPTTSDKLHQDTKALYGVIKETDKAVNFALDHHAEVIVTGVVESSPDNRNRDYMSTALEIKIIDPTTARIFATDKRSESHSGNTVKEAMDKSGKSVGEKLVSYSSQEILKWWRERIKNGILYAITLRNTPNARVTIKFEDAVKAVALKGKYVRRSSSKGILQGEVFFNDEISNLERAIYDKLASQNEFKNLDTELSRGNQIIFVLK
ncbi:MAG: hypothetical protein HQK76_15530 [Desulfobacterales bacterium]|nr:hypothetical protein [Desulfobacterales bacterium]